METIFGLLSAIIVFASYPIYIIRIWQRKITPNITSWIIFVIISIAIFLSYISSGALENGFVTYGPLIGCVAIVVVSLFRSREKTFTKTDMVCLFIAMLSIVLWYFTKQSKELVQYALYLAIIADAFGLIPTIVFLRKHPEKDRPAMWLIFSLGYLLSMFAITEHTFTNWVLPGFMVIAPAFVWVNLVNYSIKNKIPIKEWI